MADAFTKELFPSGQAYRTRPADDRPTALCQDCGARHSGPIYWCSSTPTEEDDSDE